MNNKTIIEFGFRMIWRIMQISEDNNLLDNSSYHDTRGAFHSTKNSENFGTRTNGTEISWKSFQKIRKVLTYWNANHSTENPGNSRSKIKWNWKFPEIVFENLGLPCEVVLFSGNFEKSYHFTLSLCSFGRKFSDLYSWKQLHVLRKHSCIFGRMESALGLIQ